MPQRRTRRKTERRSRPRADARLSMRVEGARDGEQAQIVTESQNISASGIYCSASHYLAPLSKVDLTIVLPRIPGGPSGQELIKCEGIVVRCQPTTKRGERHYELACMFSGLAEPHRSLIEAFVAWRNLQALRVAAGVSPDGRVSSRPRAKRRPAAARAKPSATARKRTLH